MVPKEFRKRPVVVEAVQFDPDADVNEESGLFDWLEAQCPGWDYDDREAQILIPTLEGIMRANVGDWIIRGVSGEFYPCRGDIFERTYKEVNGE